MPAQLDVLVGAGRPASRLTGGRLDRAVCASAGAFRATAVYHARRNLGRVGARSLGYDDLEENLGLSRTYRLEIAEPDQTDRVVADPARASDRRERRARAAGQHHLSGRWPIRPVQREEVLAAATRWSAAPRRWRSSPATSGSSWPWSTPASRSVIPSCSASCSAGYDVVDLGMGPINADTTLVGDSQGVDFAPVDDVGHGSHVAGVIGAQGWQVPPGVAGRSLLLPIRVLAAAQVAGETSVSGVGAISDIDLGVKVAADMGAQVINMSFGTPASSLEPGAERPHRAVIAYARQQGAVLVAAAGNSGIQEQYFPAADPGVIGVGSVDFGGRRSAFSTYGPQVALSGPGEDLIGVGRLGYRRATGTSHAAPFVAGAAALLLAHARRRGATLTVDRVRSLLTTSAQRSHSPPIEVGAGVLDIAAALAFLETQLNSAGQARGKEPDHD